MKTSPSTTNPSLIGLFIVIAVLNLLVVPDSQAQTPTNASAAAAAPAPKLTPEQRREFALLQQAVMGDAEYAAAVKRAIEAQRAADSLFFVKMVKSAKPELQPYIKFLQQARMTERPQAQ